MSTPLAVALLAADLVAIVAIVTFVLRDVARHRAATPAVSAPPAEPQRSAHPTMPAAQTVLPGGWFVPPTELLPVPRGSHDRPAGRGLGALSQP